MQDAATDPRSRGLSAYPLLHQETMPTSGFDQLRGYSN
jgi:hypothetical protein